MKFKFGLTIICVSFVCLPFFGLPVSAQVSFVEDLAPIEGFDVEKEKKRSQPQPQNINNKQLQIGIGDFRDVNLSSQNISQIVAADLYRSGQFKISNLGIDIDENTRPDFYALESKNLDCLLSGSVNKLTDGRFDIRYRLWDTVRNKDLGGQSFIARTPDLRLVAHKIADQVYEKMNGDKGIFSTRITYITKHDNRYLLWISDADGENAQVVLTSPEPIISPSWSPNGNELAYVSFETRKPVVYIHDVSTGKRRVLTNFRGSNSAPAWSPDGKTLALTLTKDGSSQIFIIDARGGEPKQITQSSGTDTQPVFTPDGSQLYFVSDSSGSPQIYRVSTQGSQVQRVTFKGNYNISPSLSIDGRWMAYISRNGSSYKLHLMDLITEKISILTETDQDGNPSFAPNGKLILYTTKEQGQVVMMTSTLDGKVKSKLSGHLTYIREEPHWGPYIEQEILGGVNFQYKDDTDTNKIPSKPSEAYIGRLRARVKPNITFSETLLESIKGNPATEVLVTVSAKGQIIDMTLIQSSGNTAWDKAVLKAIEKTETLPRDENGKIPTKISFVFRPRD